MSEHLQAILKSLEPKRPTGRPTKLTSAMLDKVCRLLGEGLTMKQTCREVGVNPDTFHEWRKTNASFYSCTEAARNRACKLGLVRWEGSYDNLR
jgi:hypothetical protein